MDCMRRKLLDSQDPADWVILLCLDKLGQIFRSPPFPRSVKIASKTVQLLFEEVAKGSHDILACVVAHACKQADGDREFHGRSRRPLPEIISEVGFAEKFWQTYSHVGAYLDLYLTRTCENISRVAEHFVQDWEILSNKIGFQFETLQSIELEIWHASSDSHFGGRRVAVVRVRTKDRDVKLVFKPRSEGVEGMLLLQKCLIPHLQDISRPRFPVIYHLDDRHRLDGRHHVWQEFVETVTKCDSEDNKRLWFRRAGALVALTTVFGLSDGHFENLLSTAEGPVLVDWETLGAQSTWLGHVQDEVSAVLATGLLQEPPIPGTPQAFWFSGLQGSAGVKNVVIGPKIVVHENKTFSHVNMLREDGLLGDGTIPFFKGKPETLSEPENVDEFLQGVRDVFVAISCLEAADVEQLATHFVHARWRIILRDTFYYDLLRRMRFHPSYLEPDIQSKLPVQEFRSSGLSEDACHFILRHELSDLSEGDVPLFLADANCLYHMKRDTNGSLTDLEPYEKVSISGLNPGSFSVKNLRSKLLDKLRWSLPAAEQLCDKLRPVISKPVEFGIAKPRAFSDTALQIWYQHSLFKVKTSELSLYKGIAGQLILLAEMQVSVQPEASNGFENRVMHIATLLKSRWQRCLPDLGIAAGVAGVIYALVHAGRVVGSDILFKWAAEIALDPALSPEVISDDTGCDVLWGSAGLLLALDSLIRIIEDTRKTELDVSNIREKLHLCALALLSKKRSADALASWECNDRNGTIFADFGGFAHGTAGIALAFARAFKRFPDVEAFRRAGLEAFRHQLGLYNVQGYFKDRRPKNLTNREDTVVWCHGAAGILPALVEAASILQPDEQDHERLFTALPECLLSINQEFSTSKTEYFCCGRAGLILCVRKVGQLTGLVAWESTYKAMRQKYVEVFYRFDLSRVFVHSEEVHSFGRGWYGICSSMLHMGNVANQELPDFLLFE